MFGVATGPVPQEDVPVESIAAAMTAWRTGTHMALPAMALTLAGSSIKYRFVDMPWRRKHSPGDILRPRLVIQCPMVRENVKHGDLSLYFVRKRAEESQSTIQQSRTGSPPSPRISANTSLTDCEAVVLVGRLDASSDGSGGSKKSSILPV